MTSCREAKRAVNRRWSKLGGPDRPERPRNDVNGAKTMDDSSYWVPHPRTGIYFPNGHESAMEDVPEGAASFNQTFWLRNVDDGVDHDPNIPPDHHHYNAKF